MHRILIRDRGASNVFPVSELFDRVRGAVSGLPDNLARECVP